MMTGHPKSQSDYTENSDYPNLIMYINGTWSTQRVTEMRRCKMQGLLNDLSWIYTYNVLIKKNNNYVNRQNECEHTDVYATAANVSYK